MVKVSDETCAIPLHHLEHTLEVIPEKVQRIHRWEILPLFQRRHGTGLWLSQDQSPRWTGTTPQPDTLNQL